MKVGDILIALCSLARTGWMLRGVPSSIAENVAQHLFIAAIIAYELSVEARSLGFQVNPERAAAIALTHDLAEAVVGDITRRAGIGEAKELAEHKAYSMLDISDDIKKLYEEYRSESSMEAVIARISDGLATYLKAKFYINLGYRVDDIARSSLETALQLATKAGLRHVVERFLNRL